MHKNNLFNWKIEINFRKKIWSKIENQKATVEK